MIGLVLQTRTCGVFRRGQQSDMDPNILSPPPRRAGILLGPVIGFGVQYTFPACDGLARPLGGVFDFACTRTS